MKKISIITLVAFTLIFTSSFTLAQDNFQSGEMNANIGVDLMGSQEASITDSSTDLDLGGSEETEIGFSAVAEYIFPYSETLNLGGGIEFQLPRKLKNSDGNFNFIPLYGLAQFNIEDKPIYFKGKAGYNFFNGNETYTGTEGNLSGGLFYGFGGGLEVQENMTIEIIYSVNNGSIEYTGMDLNGELSYSKLRTSIGFKF